jgi:signal transduction histidine kinase
MHQWIAAIAVLALWCGYLVWFALVLRRRLRAAQVPVRPVRPVRERIGALGLDMFLVPVLLGLAGLYGAEWTFPGLFMTGAALAIWTFAPRHVTSKVLPLALVGVGFYGFAVIRAYARGTSWLIRYGVATNGDGSAYPHFVLLQAYLLIAGGLWLLWRRLAPGSLASRLLTMPGSAPGQSRRPRWGLLLLPVVGMVIEMLGWTLWLDTPWWTADFTVAVGLIALVLVFRAPAVAADLALAGMLLLGLYGVALAVWWPVHVPLPSPYTADVRFGTVWVASRVAALLAGVEGLALLSLGLWLLPRAIDDRTRALLRSAADAELAGRVVRLTRTRADAVEGAEAELRRLERDLHDGAQARLVALGMSLRAAERLIPTNPAAASALVAEARESSLKVLTELRDLVRGICPPVLAERGLADAVRALVLDTPLRTDVDIDLPGRPDLPVESACYFAVAEVLANAVKHAAARQAQVRIRHESGRLRITVIDDGAGGADPRRGSGLLGLERRLATFDGVLAVNSPLGGPTIVAIEVPCALSSVKTSSC